MSMMILRTMPASPFGRKVKIATSVLGLSDKIKTEKADTLDSSDSLRKQNPLGKIPVLVLEDGTALYDSRVIVEYLDHLAGGGRIIPTEFKARIATLRLQALADGVADAAVLQMYEKRFRPEELREPKWVEHQAGKVSRALAVCERQPPALGASPQIGDIALACVLGYLDFRFEGTWRKDHPRLVAWLDQFGSQIPAFAATKPE